MPKLCAVWATVGSRSSGRCGRPAQPTIQTFTCATNSLTVRGSFKSSLRPTVNNFHEEELYNTENFFCEIRSHSALCTLHSSLKTAPAHSTSSPRGQNPPASSTPPPPHAVADK